MPTRGFAFPSIQIYTRLRLCSKYCTLIELITNTCKYAFPCTDAPTLEISCQQKDNNLQLIVADNGPGFARLEDVSVNGEVVAAKKSFGMKQIKSQAEQLNATYHFEQEGGMVFRMMFKV